jgi:hypothetical protein
MSLASTQKTATESAQTADGSTSRALLGQHDLDRQGCCAT